MFPEQIMNAYSSYAELLFTCVDAPLSHVTEVMLTAFNHPSEGLLPSSKYFAKETKHDLSLAYVDSAARGYSPLRVIFWEPLSCSGTTVFMANDSDALSYSVFRLSEDSPFRWVNIRIYDHPDDPYPACFFSCFADHRRIERELAACKGAHRWDFVQKGPIQSFENAANYEND